jgi:hypothetical protein
VGVGPPSPRDILGEGGDDFDIAPGRGRLLESNKKCYTHSTSSTTRVQRGRYPRGGEPLVSEGAGEHGLRLAS